MAEIYLDDNELNLMTLGEGEIQKKIVEKYNLPLKWVGFVPSYPMKMVDRVWYDFEKGAGKYGKGYLRAEKDITRDEWFFYCHFYGDPVMPGVMGLDGALQCMGIVMLLKLLPGVARALGGTFEYYGQVLTRVKKTRYQVDIKRLLTKPSQLLIADIDYFKDDDKEPIYKIRDARLGLFREGELERSSSYRPDWQEIKEKALRGIETSRQYYLKHFGDEGF